MKVRYQGSTIELPDKHIVLRDGDEIEWNGKLLPGMVRIRREEPKPEEPQEELNG